MDIEELTKEKIMSAVKERVNPDNIYFFNQDDIISLFLDIFELTIPPEKERTQLILQKILNGLRTYERNSTSQKHDPKTIFYQDIKC